MSKAKAGSSAMTSGGDAPATVLAKNNHLRIGGLFLAHIKEVDSELSKKWGTLWSQVPEKFACDKEIFPYISTGGARDLPRSAENRGRQTVM